MAVKVKMHFEEIKQKSLDRASAASIAGGNRATQLDIANRTLDESVKDRKERRFQLRVNEYGQQAKVYALEASDLQGKLLSATAATPEEKKAVENKIIQLQTMSGQQQELRRRALIDYDVHSGKAKIFSDPKDAAKLPSGSMFYDENYVLRRVP